VSPTSSSDFQSAPSSIVIPRAIPVDDNSTSHDARSSSSNQEQSQLWVVVGVETGDRLNAHSSPVMSSKTLFTLANGDQVLLRGASVMNGDTEWLPIISGSRTGWVSREFLQLR
jgi:hypothetical protein